MQIVSPLLTPQQVETLTGRKRNTLAIDRMRGRGIPYVKVGPRAVRYHVRDIEKYIGRALELDSITAATGTD